MVGHNHSSTNNDNAKICVRFFSSNLSNCMVFEIPSGPSKKSQ
jgi:hypothetical protein